MSFFKGTIFDRDTRSVDEVLEQYDYPTVHRVTENQGDRDPASTVDPLQEAMDKTKGSKWQQRKTKGIDKETLKERRTLRALKEQEQQFKLISDLAEVQKGITEINQANLDFYQMSSQAQLNKELIDTEIDEIIGAGQAQAGLERAKGETGAEMAQLKLAAQGQKLSGEGAKAVSRSSRIMASVRAADARSNALSRALGLEFEKTAIDRQVAYGDIQRGQAIQGGISRAAFGIADAFVRYKGVGSGEERKSKTNKEYQLPDSVKKWSEGRGPASIRTNPWEGAFVREMSKKERKQHKKAGRL